MHAIALRHLRLFSLPRGPGLRPEQKDKVHLDLSCLGYRLTDPSLLDQTDPALLDQWDDRISALKELRGADVPFVHLFLDFGTTAPDEDDYRMRRLLGYAGTLLGFFNKGRVLQNGMQVPDWLFDLKKFGADPITQQQTDQLFEEAQVRLADRKAATRVTWMDLTPAFEADVRAQLRGWVTAALTAQSSIKEALHADIRSLLGVFGADCVPLDAIVRKETRALVLAHHWQQGNLDAVLAGTKTPTDVLRLFAAVTETDVSLATPIRFPRMSRPERRAVLTVLERAPALEEDLLRFAKLWKTVARSLHTREHRARFPRTDAAVQALRTGTLASFASQTEALLRAEDLPALLTHLGGRPGVLARRLHELLRRFPGDTKTILDAFTAVGDAIAFKNLLVLQRYFATINTLEHRAVLTKSGTLKVLPNNSFGALGPEQLSAVGAVLDTLITTALKARPSWQGKTVWIDPALSDFTVPLQQRAASEGVLTYGRGSRIPVDFDAVLRLFVWWKQNTVRTDLDLSVIQLDETLGYAGHVSYTNLAESGIVHSGDLQSAPRGAAEFIDITLRALTDDVRYLAVQVHRYSGHAFREMRCHAGYMLRDHADATYATFDIKTVTHCFDLNGIGGVCIPLVVDLEAMQIILTDLYLGTRDFHNAVENSYELVSKTVRAVRAFTETRPTLGALAHLHAAHRGATPAPRETAEITFGVTGCTYNAGDVEKILAELL